MKTHSGQLSRYSDGLIGRGSNPGRVKNFLYSTASRPALGPTKTPIQWVSGVLSPGIKRQGSEAGHSPFIVPMLSDIHPAPICFHGVMLN
jgi:hypothetical protein